jgi:HD-GYP domain-containing protein (c-di-GMP phosphodiesterase class II)
VVDVYDALTSDRPHRPPWSKKDALSYIEEEAGKLFDPAIVPPFLELVREEAPHY